MPSLSAGELQRLQEDAVEGARKDAVKAASQFVREKPKEGQRPPFKRENSCERAEDIDVGGEEVRIVY